MPENQYRLLVDGLVTGYGKKLVLDGVTICVAPGEIVAIIGHNGAGKSTLLKAVFGVLPIWKGRVFLEGRHIEHPTPRFLLRDGVAYIPQGNRVFADLTVRENLEMGGTILAMKKHIAEGIERALTLFPGLKPRLNQKAGVLSGGEKQMLAFANALVLSPHLLLLDEPSLGLAPPLVTAALERVWDISRKAGASTLIVEQKVREVLNIAGRVYVLRNGQVSFSGSTDLLRDEERLRAVYL